jgi:hypothetical protein
MSEKREMAIEMESKREKEEERKQKKKEEDKKLFSPGTRRIVTLTRCRWYKCSCYGGIPT